MGSVTPFPIVGEGYTRIEVNWQDFPHARRCWIYRRLANAGSANQVALRDGDEAWLSNGIAVAFDHEAPLDTPVQYSSTVGLNWNGSFEDGVNEWLDTTNDGTVGTPTQSFDYYALGKASLRLQPSGGTTSKAVSEFIPATAGTSYTLTGKLMVPVYWTGGIGVMIQWYNGTTPNGTTGALNDVTPIPGEWGSYGFSGTAPASTTQMKIVAGITGSPPTTLPLYVDDIWASTAAGTVVAAPSMIPSSGGGWWTDPLHPATKIRLTVDLLAGQCDIGRAGVAYLGVTDEEFPADSALQEVNDSAWPVGVWNQRKSGRSSIRVATNTMTDLAAVKALHAPGAPLLLQLVSKFREADAYGLHSDVTVGRVHGDQTVDWRVMGSSFGKVLAPVGPAEGTLKTRFMDLNRFTTFAAATSAGVTWLDALQAELAT